MRISDWISDVCSSDLALGIGVGKLVGTVDLGGETISYREFVAPALLAASAMNGAVYESGNVFFKLKYAKTYEGVLATPLTVRGVASGEQIGKARGRERVCQEGWSPGVDGPLKK